MKDVVNIHSHVSLEREKVSLIYTKQINEGSSLALWSRGVFQGQTLAFITLKSISDDRGAVWHKLGVSAIQSSVDCALCNRSFRECGLICIDTI